MNTITKATLAALALSAAACCGAATQSLAKDTKVKLPDAVQAQIERLFPKAAIKESEVEDVTIRLYEVKLESKGRVIELKLAADGTLLEVEEVVAETTLPAAVRKALAARKGKPFKTELVKQHGEVRAVAFPAARTSYEVKSKEGDKTIEIVFSPEGAVLATKDKTADKDE